MSTSKRIVLFPLLAVILVSGCTLLKRTPKIPSPAGEWTYTIMSPDGDIGGGITLIGEADDLTGTLTNDVLYGAKTIENMLYDGTSLGFDFDAEAYGRVLVNVTVIGDTFSGIIQVPGYDDMPITGNRTPEQLP